MKLKEFSEIVNGIIFGDPETEITGVAGVKDAKQGDITFITSPRFLKDLQKSNASSVIVKETVEGINITQLKVSNPLYVFAMAIEYFHPKPSFKPDISNMAVVSDNAMIGGNVSISPFVYISNDVTIGDETAILPGVFVGEHTKIGSQCLIYPNVVIRENVKIGNRVIIHSGTVVGSDGFGYVYENGAHYKIPQVGGIIIEDDVEIGSNVSIDRATLGHTIIGKGTKIDNLVQIGHNVRIGRHCIIVAQVGIGGSTEIGNYVTLGGQVGVADHVQIEDGCILGGMSGVMGHLTKGVYLGVPAVPRLKFFKSHAMINRLPEILKRISNLENKLESLENDKTKNNN